jgi:hypothetical protein
MKLTAACLAALGLRFAARADVADFTDFQDATLLGGTDSNATTGVNESLAVPGMFVGTDGQGNPKRSLIEFNIPSKIPAGSIITAVQLTMTAGQIAGSGGGSGSGSGGINLLSLYNETQAWGQPTNRGGASSFGGTGHGNPASPGDATWLYAFSTATPWSTAVGGNWTTNSASVGAANSTLTAGNTVVWSSTNAGSANMVTSVQNWLDNPSNNFGWLLKNADESDATTFDAFWGHVGASNAGNISLEPDLQVTFTETPEPSGVFLLAAGLPLYLRRNRKSQFSSAE